MKRYLNKFLGLTKACYAVALPTELYAGIELHAELPKNLKNEYIHINNKLGFKS